MEFLKNFAISIRATGPAAVLVALILSICALGLFGGEQAEPALNILTIFGGMILGSMIIRAL